MSDDDALRRLAAQAGISVEWRNHVNEPRTVAPDTLRAVLAAMGLPCYSPGDIADSGARLTPVPGIAGLAPLITTTAGTPTRIPVHPTVRVVRLSFRKPAVSVMSACVRIATAWISPSSPSPAIIAC